MLATVRNRRGVISSVEPYEDAVSSKLLHLVTVEYTEYDGEPEETLLWERECQPVVLEPNALPRVGDEAPMQHPDMVALQRASRWSAITPFLSAHSPHERSESTPTAPVYGAVSADDFQLVPLARAMRMPRVSLLLADDVGLGKTVEAGLILAELIRKRRIRRVLIITPASLRHQWQSEMEEKFSLGFDVVDRPATHKLQREFGLDVNPWRALPRIITSYHYLRQPDVLEQFEATCRAVHQGHVSAQLPWDLLIVDEAHNLMPSNFGEDSDLAQMLRRLTPWFEHRLFLTATPHNGYTRCFSGLLEQLDPVRFTRTPTFTDKERKMIGDVLVRRLKSEINKQDEDAGRFPRFASRHLEPQPLYLLKGEKNLATAVRAFCDALKRHIRATQEARMVLNFAIEILRKRLMSSPVAFADSWLRFKLGLEQQDEIRPSEVAAAQRATEEDIDDDQERESRGQHAAHIIGSWMHPYVDLLAAEIGAVDDALAYLKLDRLPATSAKPTEDARYDRLKKLIDDRLRDGGKWGDSERLIVFTEYKTTLDYLVNRLRAEYGQDDKGLILLYGGMDDQERESVKKAFNDFASPARILIATDAASEGLNLQQTARLLLHYEIPWNPSRLEQRNGRLDRHGQARDVTVYHFASDDDADLRFVAKVIGKVNEIREDLGSVGELFDAAFQRRMMEQQDDHDVFSRLDSQIKTRRHAADEARIVIEERGVEEQERFQQLLQDLDLSPDSLKDTLRVALGIGSGRDILEGPDERGRMRLSSQLSGQWQAIVNDYLRLPDQRGAIGAIPWLVFDPQFFIQHINGRPVFRQSLDTVLVHLGHPMLRHALASFARLRFPGAQADRVSPSRWTVTEGQVPSGADALLLFTVEEMAINELRETFHHWVRTLAIPVKNGALGDPLPYNGPNHGDPGRYVEARVAKARDLWDEVDRDLSQFLKQYRASLTESVRKLQVAAGAEARDREKEAFERRINEVAALQRSQSVEKLKREIEERRSGALQLSLLEDANEIAERQMRDLEDELKRRTGHFGELLERLKSEKARILERVIPSRFTLRGEMQVFPITVEIRFPEVRP
ncbi:DISARM system SNF2-like helicase DrmD [Geomonas nitrogeniifigens]|uniref:DISARM system SNF2-like helicase DrmD n=1 Tax=Geomonas diazotrophica TaxID=2843197 RepID=UPI001C2C7BB3|nr:DISARM system SNF2-like helicase DrmD [Geomonas nitrogeniifigens]QXE87381.1 DISARM system SNF2-like helicase DrmD [Geomonas nitrogeniifigens]